MKQKTLKTWRQKSIKELEVIKAKVEEELVKLRIDKGAGKLKDVHQLEKKGRDLARIKTILGEKARS